MRFRKLIGALLAAASFSAVAAIPPTETTEIVEFYNAALDHYFITLGPKEIQDLDSGVHPGWTRTGYRFLVVKNGSAYAGSVPVCRFYGRPEKGIDSHFYSAKASECEDVKNKFADAWIFETAEAFRAFPVNVDGSCPADTAPVYRLYALPDTTPPKPGLLRVAPGEGGRIEIEVWEMPLAEYGSFVALVPAPLSIGSLQVADGSSVQGFLCEPLVLQGAADITHLGGWRAYLACTTLARLAFP